MRYFIGFNLDDKDAALVNTLRYYVADKFLVKEALACSPHLTLFYPFEIDEQVFEMLEKCLNQFVQDKYAFVIGITGFNHFDEAVWFVDVEQNSDLFDLKKALLEMMQEKLQISENGRGKNKPHFHITLAYKDVTSEKFKLIGNYLNSQSLPIKTLHINAITLFKNNGKEWEAVRKFDLIKFKKK